MVSSSFSDCRPIRVSHFKTARLLIPVPMEIASVLDWESKQPEKHRLFPTMRLLFSDVEHCSSKVVVSWILHLVAVPFWIDTRTRKVDFVWLASTTPCQRCCHCYGQSSCLLNINTYQSQNSEEGNLLSSWRLEGVMQKNVWRIDAKLDFKNCDDLYSWVWTSVLIFECDLILMQAISWCESCHCVRETWEESIDNLACIRGYPSTRTVP